MRPELRAALVNCETDLDEVSRRFLGDEPLYVECLGDFLSDPTVTQLGDALLCEAWDDAFTAAHALKGLAGNMGFIPLFHAAAEMVMLIRAGRTDELGESYTELTKCYVDITEAIRQNCDPDQTEED